MQMKMHSSFESVAMYSDLETVSLCTKNGIDWKINKDEPEQNRPKECNNHYREQRVQRTCRLGKAETLRGLV